MEELIREIRMLRKEIQELREEIKPRKSRFVSPSLDEIREYISENNLNVKALEFYNYFTTGDWKDAKGKPVKNWKQKLLTWHKHAKTDSYDFLAGAK